jgi:hypothetical protein
VLGEDARPKIVGVAGQIADDDPDGFSLIAALSDTLATDASSNKSAHAKCFKAPSKLPEPGLDRLSGHEI